MNVNSNIRNALTLAEKQQLKQRGIRTSEVLNYAVDELETLLDISSERAREIQALIEFQIIPSIGVKFARLLVDLGYYSIEDLKGKDGVQLVDDYEIMKGYWMDPCVEDQFRLAVHYANTRDGSKRWWDFTTERKRYRQEKGYPQNRPEKAWYEIHEMK